MGQALRFAKLSLKKGWEDKVVQLISGRPPYWRMSVAGAAAALLAAGSAQAATVTRSVFGTAADGQTVYLFTLKNHHGMTVKFSTRGGSIVEIDAPDRKGVGDNLVIGKADFAGWESGANAILGRYANRIGGGGFTLDGTFYKLSGANPKTNVVIHGGTDNYFHKLWKGEAFQHGEEAGATLSLVSPDGESGFPGELTIKVNYSLDEHNRLKLEYWATTTKPTVVNLSNHANFNIGGYDLGPVYNQVLQVFASHYTPTDSAQVPTGEIAPVEGTPFDFRKPTELLQRLYSNDPQMMIGKGLDHNFVLDKPPGAEGTGAGGQTVRPQERAAHGGLHHRAGRADLQLQRRGQRSGPEQPAHPSERRPVLRDPALPGRPQQARLPHDHPPARRNVPLGDGVCVLHRRQDEGGGAEVLALMRD